MNISYPGILCFKPFVDAPAAMVPFASMTIIPGKKMHNNEELRDP